MHNWRWNSDGTPWVTKTQFKALSPNERRALFATRDAAKRHIAAVELNSTVLRGQVRRQVVVTIVLGAVFVGIIVAALHLFG
jgi:hypothetical protein